MSYIQKRLEQQNQTISPQYFSKFKGLPFWIWEPQEQKREYDRTKGKGCCFNHAIPAGPPERNGKNYPLFDYEKLVLDNLLQYRRLYVLKATGLRLTTLLTRFLCHRCLVNDDWKGKNAVIITGPRLELSVDLIRRMKSLFPDFYFDTKETVIELGGVRVEAFPSHNTRSLRGLKDCVFVLADEASFFNIGQESDEVRAVIERMIAKSDPYVALISTPNMPGDLMDIIKSEPDDQCLYKRMFLDYRIGEGKIYDDQELQQAKLSPSFDRVRLSFHWWYHKRLSHSGYRVQLQRVKRLKIKQEENLR
jgi:hypothetical protein